MEEEKKPMDLETVRVLKDALIGINKKGMEFIPMFTNVLLDMLQAYETEIDRINLHIGTLNEEINSLNEQLDAAQDDAISTHGGDI